MRRSAAPSGKLKNRDVSRLVGSDEVVIDDDKLRQIAKLERNQLTD